MLESYLDGRKQLVRVDQDVSSKLLIKDGVPQGSILGPVLFLIYINDIKSALNGISCLLYADDTTLLGAGPDLRELRENCRNMQSNAEMWFSANKLKLNENKTVTMISSTKNLSNLDNNPGFVKFLGINLDPKLTWNAHGNLLAESLARTTYALRQLSNRVSMNILRTAYYALFHSKLAYGILAWGHSACRHRLFGLQRRAVRVVGGIGYRADAKPIFIDLNILTFPSIYALECLTYVKKHINEFATHKENHNYNTRKRDDVYLCFKSLTKSRTGIAYHGPKLFNKLENNIKQLPLDRFRSAVKKFLTANAFYSLDEIEMSLGNISL